jgi:DNA ligase 1
MEDGVEDDAASSVAGKESTPPTSADFRDKKQKRDSPTDDEDEDWDVQPALKRRKKGFELAKADVKTSTKAAKESPKPSKSQNGTKDPKAEVSTSKTARSQSVSSSVVEEEQASEEEEDSTSEAEEIVKVNKKQVEEIAATVKGTGKDPYPDWRPEDPVPYAALCTTFSLVEMTTKRLQISAQCALFLQQVLRLTPNDLLPTIQLMINKLAADYAGIELGIGESLIMKAIGESTGRSLQAVKTDHQKVGDLGLVAAKSRGKQSQFMKPKPLTVRGVHEGLLAIAKMDGHGSQDKKVGAIKKMLAAADVNGLAIDIEKDKGGPSESKFLVRFLEGKLRLGLAEKTVTVALAHAVVNHETAQKGNKIASTEQLAKGEAELKLVYSELPSYEVIIPAMLEHGLFKLHESCKLQPGVPLKPMLAKPTKSITEVLDRFEGKDFTCEYKYDGERAQIHYVAPEAMADFPAASSTLIKDSKAFKGLASIFSRNSEDLSKKYPDILEKLNAWVKPTTNSFVLDCETVAWDLQEKKVLPFQHLMTRKRKDVKASEITVKVCVFAFDMLFYNGEATVKKTLRERRELLHEAFEPVEGEFAFAQFGDTKEIDEIQVLLDDSVKSGCEGLMVKMLDTEESGYEPSKRSRNWLKVKKDYLSGIGDSLDLVVLGAYYGKGKRTSWYGAFLLAAYNSDTEKYETVCNIGTGFSEEKLEEFHNELSELVIDKPKPFYSHSHTKNDQPDVWFEARHVWEVKTADLTLSPRYMAAMDEMGVKKGISLRFPRFIQRRDDKKPDEATTTKAVAEMYRKQESIGKESKGGVDDDFEY